jgi:hypothetical protein
MACDEVKAALDDAQRDYDNAARAESAAEWSQWGQIAATAGSTAATIACWGLEPATLGSDTALCVAGTVATLGEWAQSKGAWDAEDLAEEAREAAEIWLDEMDTAYCWCLENDGFEAPPEPPDITPPEPYDPEEYFDYPMDDAEEGGCCADE